MKRYPFVIGATAAGLVGVLSFHTSAVSTALPSDNGAAGATPTAGSSSTTTPSTAAPTTTAPSGSSATTTPTTTAPATTVPPTTKSATGAVAQYHYGQLSVTVTISGGKITKVTLATLEVAEPRSEQIADESIPVLEREVLDAQSATISAVSGATYTSEAYEQSVQSALDKLGK